MAKDLLITPASGKLEFKTESTVDAKLETDANGNLLITNPSGDISIGDTSADVYIGDGVNNVDLVFEQDGSIRGTAGVTITLGASGSNIAFASDLNLSGNDLLNVGTISSGRITITDNAVPLIFNESGVTGEGAWWRQVLDGKNIRFDASLTGDSAFTTYRGVFTIHNSGLVTVNDGNFTVVNGYANSVQGYRVNATEIVDSSRNIVNINSATVKNITIENPAGIGFIHLGTISNDAGSEYIRGALLISRNEDQITYNAATDTWNHAGGSSTDWSMIAHKSGGPSFYTGPAVATSTDYTNTEFNAAYRWLSVDGSTQVASFNNRPKVGTNDIWHSGDFSSTDISNWDTAYTYSQVGHLPLSGGTSTGAISATKFLGTAQDSTAPTADDARFDGYGVQGNRDTNPVYIHNHGDGGIRISSNGTLGTPNGLLVTDTEVTVNANLVAGNTTTAQFLRAHYSDGSYMTLQGYGLEMNKASSYIRPTTDGDKILYLGGSDASLDWLGIDLKVAGNGVRVNGTEVITSGRLLVNIQGGNFYNSYNFYKDQITENFYDAPIKLVPSQVSSGGRTNIFYKTGSTSLYGISAGAVRSATTGRADFEIRSLHADTEGDQIFLVENSGLAYFYNTVQTPAINFYDGTNSITASMLSTDTLSFSGDSGQLFSISDSLSGTIFAVNDISGVPSIEVDDDGTIRLAETFGNVLIGTAVDDGTNKVQINGNSSLNGNITVTSDNSYLTMGVPGNGAAVGGRYISIEGNTGTDGEGSGRIFFTEHNSTTASMDNFGFSIGYRGGDPTIVGASGNTWNGLADIGNGQWGMWGHNASLNGSLIMYGDRGATFVNFSGNYLSGVGYLQIGSTTVIDASRNLTNIGTINGSTIANWDTAYGWGNHASAGYRLSSESLYYKPTRELQATALNLDTAITPGIYRLGSYTWHTGFPSEGGEMGYANIIVLDNSDVHSQLLVDRADNGRLYIRSATTNDFSAIDWNRVWSNADFTSTQISNWDTAYGWGDHSTAGYLTSESDTLATVTGRGASTSVITSFTNGSNALSTTGGAVRITGGLGVGYNIYAGLVISAGSGYRVGTSSTNSVQVIDSSRNLVNIGTISSGAITSTGNVTAYSDERLKSNIETLDGKKVLEMRGVSFIKDGNPGSGVIAQELEKVAPELVHTGEYKSVAYGNLTGYLIEAIKEQQSQIERLEKLVQQLMEK